MQGQFLPINQNRPFSLFGTTYGGNGQTTLRCRICGAKCRSCGDGHTWEKCDSRRTLTISELPTHIHDFSQNTAVVSATANATGVRPRATIGPTTVEAYSTGGVSLGAMSPQTVSNVGVVRHNQNMQRIWY